MNNVTIDNVENVEIDNVEIDNVENVEIDNVEIDNVEIDISKINIEQLKINIDKIIEGIDINKVLKNVLIVHEQRIIDSDIHNYSIINTKKNKSTILHCQYCNKEYIRPKCLETHEKECKKKFKKQ